jgi:hypothetical protein
MSELKKSSKSVGLSPDTNSRRHVVLDKLADEHRKGRLTDTQLRSLWEIAKQFMKDPVCI